MKTIALLTSTMFLSAVAFAQDANNDHGKRVSAAATSETATHINKGEMVSSTASLNSQASIKSLNTPYANNEEKREQKEAAAAKRAEAKAELGAALEARKETAIDFKDAAASAALHTKNEAANRAADLKAHTAATASAGLEAGASASRRGTEHAKKAASIRAAGATDASVRGQLRRNSVRGSVGAASKLHL